MSQDSIKVGDVIEVETERLAYGGDAVARVEGLAVFIRGGAPHERVRARVIERKKNFARAVIDRIIDPSQQRREPLCRYFGDCGGCQLQHLSYQAQLEAKAGFIRDALARIGRIDWREEIKVHSASELGYRSRAQIKLEPPRSPERRGELRIGFNRAGSHSVCDVESCPVLVPELDAALASIRTAVKQEADASAYGGPFEIEMAAGDHGLAVFPEVAGFAATEIERRIGEHTYRFNATNFFQVNALLLDRFVAEATGNESGEVALDLYAGVGLFTLPLARRFEKVIGVESDPPAAKCARANLAGNGISNVEFHNERVERWLAGFKGRADLILLDPPRSGASEAVSPILQLKPPTIRYVSCDPTTLARDLRRLAEGGYKIAAITAFDLFPQTYHVETMVTLKG